MLRILITAAVLLLSTQANAQGIAEAIGGYILDWNRKCGILSGKMPDEFTDEEYKKCASWATKANKFLGLPEGGGFVRKPHVARALDGKPVTILGNVQACNGSRHVADNNGYLGRGHVDRFGNIEVCTKPIPTNVTVTGLTCQAHGPRGEDACVNNGNTNDCPWTATVQTYIKFSTDGIHYCWWVYNESDKGRDYSISVR